MGGVFTKTKVTALRMHLKLQKNMKNFGVNLLMEKKRQIYLSWLLELYSHPNFINLFNNVKTVQDRTKQIVKFDALVIMNVSSRLIEGKRHIFKATHDAPNQPTRRKYGSLYFFVSLLENLTTTNFGLQ